MSFPADELDYVYVCWEDFFGLAKDPANWAKEAASILTCGFADSRHRMGAPDGLGPCTVYTFDTVDRDFRNEFALCEECVGDCADYVDWWLATMADEYYLQEYGTNVLLVDIRKLGTEEQTRYRRLQHHKMTTK